MRVLKTILLSTVGLLLVAILALGFIISRTDDYPTASAASTAEETATVMKYACYGGPEVLQDTVIEKPVPGPGEVLVKVHYAGVNPLDWHRMRGSA